MHNTHRLLTVSWLFPPKCHHGRALQDPPVENASLERR
jgi:hypothetical protein